MEYPEPACFGNAICNSMAEHGISPDRKLQSTEVRTLDSEAQDNALALPTASFREVRRVGLERTGNDRSISHLMCTVADCAMRGTFIPGERPQLAGPCAEALPRVIDLLNRTDAA